MEPTKTNYFIEYLKLTRVKTESHMFYIMKIETKVCNENKMNEKMKEIKFLVFELKRMLKCIKRMNLKIIKTNLELLILPN